MLSIGLRAIRWRIAPLVHAPPLVAATTRLMATRPKRKPMMAPQPKQEAVGARTGEDASMLQLASLRLICDQGKVLGVMPPQQARDEAAARGLLLLEVQARAEPPIWRLVATLPSRAEPIDEAALSRSGPGSQGRGSAGKQTTMRPVNKEARVKEMRLVDKSADHDVDTKMNFARGQLEKGRIVQVHMDMDMDLNMDMDMHMHMHMHTWTWTWTQHGHSTHAACTRHAAFTPHARARARSRCTSWTPAGWSRARPPRARQRSWRASARVWPTLPPSLPCRAPNGRRAKASADREAR